MATRLAVGDARNQLVGAFQKGYGSTYAPTDQQFQDYGAHYGFGNAFDPNTNTVDSDAVSALSGSLSNANDRDSWSKYFGVGPGGTATIPPTAVPTKPQDMAPAYPTKGDAVNPQPVTSKTGLTDAVQPQPYVPQTPQLPTWLTDWATGKTPTPTQPSGQGTLPGRQPPQPAGTTGGSTLPVPGRQPPQPAGTTSGGPTPLQYAPAAPGLPDTVNYDTGFTGPAGTGGTKGPTRVPLEGTGGIKSPVNPPAAYDELGNPLDLYAENRVGIPADPSGGDPTIPNISLDVPPTSATPPGTSAPPAAVPPNGNPYDPNYIRQNVEAILRANGLEPTDGPGPGNVAYWVDVIGRNKGWESYWATRIPQEIRAWQAGTSPGSPGYTGRGGSTPPASTPRTYVPQFTNPTPKPNGSGMGRLDPALSGTGPEAESAAYQYILAQVGLIGHSVDELTPAQTSQIQKKIGYVPGGPITGQMVNAALDELDALWGTGNAVNPVPQTPGLPDGPDVENPPAEIGDNNNAGDSQFSQLLDGALAKLIANGGATDYQEAISKYLAQMVANGGKIDDPNNWVDQYLQGQVQGGDFYQHDPNNYIDKALQGTIDNGGNFNQGLVDRQIESAREASSKVYRTGLNDARGQLASRGLISNPGVPQGAEVTAIERLGNDANERYGTNVRDIMTGEMKNASDRYSAATGLATGRQTSREQMATTRQSSLEQQATGRQGANDQLNNDRLMGSLQMMTGLSDSQTNAMLSAIGSGTTRQQVLGNLALQNLDQNRQWNQFLAQYGLDKQKIINDLNSGNYAQLQSLLSMFMNFTSMTNGGYIPYDN